MNEKPQTPAEKGPDGPQPPEGPSSTEPRVPGKEEPPRNPKLADPSTRRGVFGRWPMLLFLLPFVVYLSGQMFAGYLESLRVKDLKELQKTAKEARQPGDKDEGQRHSEQSQSEENRQSSGGESAGGAANVELPTGGWYDWFPLDRTLYPIAYTVAVALSAVVILLVSPGYFRVPFRVSWLSAAVGAVGIVVWIGLWWIDKHFLGLGAAFTSWFRDARPSFNPFEQLGDNPRWMWQFLAIRFAGLVLIVPLVEEFFLRGFLMRYVDDPDWDLLPLGEASKAAIIAVAVYGAVAHPAEPLAAIVWFSMVTWLYLKTRSIWDCVAAHAITNLLLGLFVLGTGTWELW